MKKICVLGGGAIGSCVSASLTDAGLDIILVDQWADHINKIRRDGLTVTTKEGEKNTKVSAYHMSDLAKLQPQFDFILMAVKAYDTQWVSKFASVYLNDKGVLKLINLRSKIYFKADCKVNCDNLNKFQIVKKILKIYENKTNFS